MGLSITTDQANFAHDVLEASYQKPVLVDFFATWCGPCQMLKPLLEKLAQEYDFVLAKVDIDQNQELAQAYDVQGVPDVRIVLDGEVTEGFVGVLPEPQLRELMAQLNLKSTLEIGLTQVYDAAVIGQMELAQTTLKALLDQYPDNRELQLEAAEFMIEAEQFDEAGSILKSIQDNEKGYSQRANALKATIQFKRASTQSSHGTELDQQFQKAAELVVQKDYQAALEILLELVSRDRTYRDDGARKAMLDVFNLLGNEHPLTTEYRKRLMLILY